MNLILNAQEFSSGQENFNNLSITHETSELFENCTVSRKFYYEYSVNVSGLGGYSSLNTTESQNQKKIIPLLRTYIVRLTRKRK